MVAQWLELYTILVDQKACIQGPSLYYESLCKNVFLGERLVLECLSSCWRTNEYQQFVGQPELQKYWILRGIWQQVTAVAPHLRRLRVR